MIPPKGHNLKYFYNNEAQVIRRATASVSDYHETLGFNVPTDKKAIIKKSLGNLVVAEWDAEEYGTWLDVSGIDNIKNALLRLKNENLISEDFYNEVIKNFPQPGGGTTNILEHSYPIRHARLKTDIMRSFIQREIKEDNHALQTTRQLVPFLSPNSNPNTQLIPAQYSYAAFQQTLFTSIQEKVQDNEYVLIDNNEVINKNIESGKTTQCNIM